ncbi:MAG: adenosylcobinamide-GDP ribazoletransferase [Chloroflexota bacterium]
MSNFWLAFSFLTTLPVPNFHFDKAKLGQAGLWFPLVGTCLGGLLAGAYWLLSGWLPASITAVLVIMLWAGLTGGLHLDGLADCCDALLAPVSPARRLEILRDPRLGTFGAVGLLLVLLLKITAVSHLTTPVIPFLLATVLARWCVLPLARLPQARKEGFGVAFAADLTNNIVAGAAILPLIIIGWAIWVGGLTAVLATIIPLSVAGLITRFGYRRLEGATGDLFGLVIEGVETAVLVVFTL